VRTGQRFLPRCSIPQAHAKFLAWVKYKGQRYEKQKVKLQRKQDEAKFEELAKKLGKNVV